MMDKPCKYNHSSGRSAKTGRCIECTRLHSEKKRKANPEKAKQSVANAWAKNKDRYRARQIEQVNGLPDGVLARRKAAYYSNNRGEISEKRKAYRKTHPELVKEQAHQSYLRNKEKYIERAHERSRRRRMARPAWLTEEQIKEMRLIYKACPKGHEVDHIVPLNGETVCGLDVPWNLQHLSRAENRRKSNKLFSV